MKRDYWLAPTIDYHPPLIQSSHQRATGGPEVKKRLLAGFQLLAGRAPPPPSGEGERKALHQVPPRLCMLTLGWRSSLQLNYNIQGANKSTPKPKIADGGRVWSVRVTPLPLVSPVAGLPIKPWALQSQFVDPSGGAPVGTVPLAVQSPRPEPKQPASVEHDLRVEGGGGGGLAFFEHPSGGGAIASASLSAGWKKAACPPISRLVVCSSTSGFGGGEFQESGVGGGRKAAGLDFCLPRPGVEFLRH